MATDADPTAVNEPNLSEADALEVLARGELHIEGRLMSASNATLYVAVELDGVAINGVYKPTQGERPLWDFPTNTLGHREVAAYELSALGGWEVVPPTAWREDGPFGPGSCQLWIEVEETNELVDFVAPDAVPTGWLRVLEAESYDGAPVALVHADSPDLRAMAVFDVIANNADRKGGHVLVDEVGNVRGVDHGVSFNLDDKLRTVLWGWAGQALTAGEVEQLCHLDEQFGSESDVLQGLAGHLSAKEVRRTHRRIRELLQAGVMPVPSQEWPAIPWPAF